MYENLIFPVKSMHYPVNTMTYTERAIKIRGDLYKVFGYGAISRAARLLGVNQSYISNTLSQRHTSNPMLAKLERLIEEHS